MPINWSLPLHFRQGSWTRLDGLDVFYDFDWIREFGHDRAIFPHGQSLANAVRRDTPPGKRPTLLLTIREDVDAGTRETDDRYIAIIPIREYVHQADADAAATHYARHAGAPMTRLPSLSEVKFSTQELAIFLDQNLNETTLSEWVEADPARRAMLSDLLSLGGETARPEDVSRLLRQLNASDDELISDIVSWMERVGGDQGVAALVHLIAESKPGRDAVTHEYGRRLPERLADTRAVLLEYEALLERPGVRETDVQVFLEKNPWIVGLAYVRVRARFQVPRGEVDFILDRSDGFFDIVELKGPADEIISERGAELDRPGSPSGFSLSPALGKALAQAHLYRSLLEAGQDLERYYGLASGREPRVLILIGRNRELSETGREILRQLNLTLHRVEIVPFDVVAVRTRTLLDNLEAMVSVAEDISQRE